MEVLTNELKLMQQLQEWEWLEKKISTHLEKGELKLKNKESSFFQNKKQTS